jgi:putative transposase
MEWARILAYITGTVDQELLLRNEYLVAENRILKSQLKGRLKLSDVERTKLGEIGHRLGRKALGEASSDRAISSQASWIRCNFEKSQSDPLKQVSGCRGHGAAFSCLRRR